MDAEGMDFLLDAVDRFPVREEFADNLDQPDPVPLLYLLHNGAGDHDAGAANSGSGVAHVAGEDGSPMAQGDARRRRYASPTRSAQSTDWVNPDSRGPGWIKRLRLGSAPPDRTACPSRMSALELTIHKYVEQPDKSVMRPGLGLSFDSLGDRLWDKIWEKQAKC
ncbi:uncharacterized protein LOC119309310 [Triticum dicoccoides]|uniref:uncharacterized protein LOC119309310 n=1 Tax=Triticum dicoccoides TaxID=85692 RepID=UPI000E7C36D7|nr:uncharacterized protein LOC119309310 [Triticum dicoccoides]